MKRKSAISYWSRLVDLLHSMTRLDVPAYAGNAGYFIILSAVPTLMLLLNVLSYTSLSPDSLLEFVDGFLPSALIPLVHDLITMLFENRSGTLVSVSALTALWASSRGMYSVLVGLNRVYDAHENRGYVYTRVISLLYTFLMLVVLILTLFLYVFRQNITVWLGQFPGDGFRFLVELLSGTAPFLFWIQSALFLLMYMYLPNRKNKLLTSLPGALFSSLGWKLFSFGFSIYVEHFASFSNIYGSLSAVVIAMLWLYICISIIFYGGALNKYLTDIGCELRLKRRRKQEAQEADRLMEQHEEEQENPEA